ncbi:GreA/GreB family elongation factor [Phenylobacterium terrae]|uniref:GreA/GreB family elongation factor n=1 Tax=Phenylobacterium terrae TaxID=2665495 RepID=A0ABW4N0T4_9CAUL
MTKTTTTRAPARGDRTRPAVYVAASEFDRLANLAETFHGPGARLLAQELDRAVVVEARRPRRGFVRLHSTVSYLDHASGQERTVALTLPSEADIDQGRLSVTAPAGAALIGLSVGDVFSWRGDDGRVHELTVLRVTDPDPAG